MIRHRPYGRGHPYLIEPDQRVPAQPVAGTPLELRATTDPAVREVTVEIESCRAVTRVEAVLCGSARPDVNLVFGAVPQRAAAATHLSAAASETETGRLAWTALLPPLQPDSTIRYRFVARSDGATSRTRWFETAAASWHTSGGTLSVFGEPVDRVLRKTIRWLRGPAGPSRIRFALRLEPNEHVSGFGERFNYLDQRGQRLDAVVFEQYKGQGARTYLPMPFAIVVGANGCWGFHVATSRRVWFDVGATDHDRLWIEVDLTGDRIGEITVQLFEGTPTEILDRFLDSTARPKSPPDWIFQPWMSGNEWNTQERVLAEVARSEQEGIPAGVIVIEAWSDESTFAAFRDAQYEPHPDGSPHRLDDFTFPADGAWPDPKAMVDGLHRHGLKVLLWQIPLVKARPAPRGQARHDRDTMIERGYAVQTEQGKPYRNRGWWFPGALLPDWTNAEAREWWLAKRRYLLEEIGIDGFKTDGGEHVWGHDLCYSDGSDGGTTNNRYPVLYAAAYHELMQHTATDGVTFSRAGFTGAAAYPCHWAGDEDSTWEAFRASIIAGLTAGASGIFFWGWDLAGFAGEIPSAELYLRAAAAACFCPIMQYHSEFNQHRKPSRDRTPWNIADRTGDARVIPIYRRFAQLRQRLVPYLSAQARISVATGRPLMRAPFFDWPSDARIWEFPFQYMLGDQLLVAPVVEPDAERRRVYLPTGEWVDAWTGAQHEGPKVEVRATPLHEIPVYIRAEHAAESLALFAEDDAEGDDDYRIR